MYDAPIIGISLARERNCWARPQTSRQACSAPKGPPACEKEKNRRDPCRAEACLNATAGQDHSGRFAYSEGFAGFTTERRHSGFSSNHRPTNS
jgi:hypothetical protein